MKKKTLFILLFSVLFFGLLNQSCNLKTGDNLLPNITGKPGEIIIVIDPMYWESAAGDTLKKIFTQLYPSLPQEELIFTVAHIAHTDFNYVFKTHRNLIFIDINNTIPKDSAQIIIKKDIWAKGQLIFDCKAVNSIKMAEVISEQRDKIISLINGKERERIAGSYKKLPDGKVINYLKNKFDIYMPVPTGFNLNIDTTDFAWISREDPELSQGLIVYSYPYTDTNTFTLDYLVNKRNEFLKKYLPGPLDGTWMTTETRIGLNFKEFTYHGRYFAEVRGLWRVENDFMGGPFVSITTLDKKNNRIITAEGYFYGPKFKKREYVRQLETIIYNLEVLNKE